MTAMEIIGLLAFITLLVLALVGMTSVLKANADRERAAGGVPDDVPAFVWLLVPALTIGLPVWVHVGYTPASDGTPEWLTLTFVAVGGFVISLVLVLLVGMLIRVIQYGLPKLTYLPIRPVPVTPTERIASFIGAAAMIGYGIYGLCVDDLWLPGGKHFHGTSAIFAFIAYLVIMGSCLVSRMVEQSEANAKWALIGILTGVGILVFAMHGLEAQQW